TVSVRNAQQIAVHLPGVAVQDGIGAGRLGARMRQDGSTLVLPKGEVPGVAMGLGGVGGRLSDLVMLYAGLARLGTAVPLIEQPVDTSLVSADTRTDARRLMEPVPAWYVGSILLGTPPPENAPGGRIAFKT